MDERISIFTFVFSLFPHFYMNLWVLKGIDSFCLHFVGIFKLIFDDKFLQMLICVSQHEILFSSLIASNTIGSKIVFIIDYGSEVTSTMIQIQIKKLYVTLQVVYTLSGKVLAGKSDMKLSK